MTFTRRTFLAGVASAAVASSLPGCSDKSNTTAKLGGRKKVRLTYSLASFSKPRGALVQTLGDQGIDVEWIGPFPNHAPTLQAVATDSADFSFGGSSTPAIQALLSGSRLTFVSWTEYLPRSTSIIVLPSSGIKSVRDLVGKTVATNKAGVSEFLLVAALEKYGVPRDKVNVSYLNPPDAAPAFAAGKIDAWAIWSGPLELAEEQYGAQRIFVEGDELKQQVDFGSYLVREDYARDELDTVRKVVSALKADYDWAREHHEEAYRPAYTLAKYPEPVIQRLLKGRIGQQLHLMDTEGVAKLQSGADWLAEHKVLSGRLDVGQHSILV